jgi:hypothetical protein
MIHYREPDRFNGYQWEVWVEANSGAETAHKAFATETEALAQGAIWRAEMDRTGMIIGASLSGQP